MEEDKDNIKGTIEVIYDATNFHMHTDEGGGDEGGEGDEGSEGELNIVLIGKVEFAQEAAEEIEEKEEVAYTKGEEEYNEDEEKTAAKVEKLTIAT